MIIWRGLGFLAILIPIALFIMLAMILPKDSSYVGLGFSIGGILNWFVGKALNRENYRIKKDENTGQDVISINDHSMFWVKIEYWSVVFFFTGLSFVGKELENSMMDTIMSALAFISFLGIALYTFLNRNKKVKVISGKGVFQDGKVKSKDKQTGQSKFRIIKKDESTKADKISEPKAYGNKDKAKQEYFDKLRNNSGKLKSFEPTDHSEYMPK